ncbi:MAG: homocysteine S-methyltransferase family protein, partial [Phycisphaeraceae bacterium]|nr:homocysteine S-methyltransferase family protein [Phycisphaeraceae bacterium]
MSHLLKQLRHRVLLLDGAMGTSVHKCDLDLQGDFLDKENCTEVLVHSRPDVVQSIHESFLAAGSDMVETNTFGANPLVLAEFDLAPQTRALNEQASQIARAACDRFTSDDKPRFVAGSIGPGTKLITLGHTDWDMLFASYLEQVRGLLDGGVDVLLIETAQDLLQIKVVINACLEALSERSLTTDEVPIMTQVTIETTGTMLLGTEISAAAVALGNYPIMSMGLNCATGPTQMAEHVQWLGRHWPGMISVVPNAGMPALVEGKTVYPLAPEPFADAMMRFVEESGVNIVGGCCGTTPDHIAVLVQRIRDREPAAVEKQAYESGCTSLYGAVEYDQDVSILNIGERCNASGSRKFKRLLEEEDLDGIMSLAKGQFKEGSHVIDVNVDYAGRDNAADMRTLVSRFARELTTPLMLDSTQPATIEAGLKA